MNRGQREYYKRDYAQAKAEGKPFFPYAVYKDLLIATLTIGIVIALAIWQRVEVGEPVNPATTDFVPRPEWYFLFLFELLRIFTGQNVLTPVIMATFIIPNILMVLLILTPFIDRSPERRPHRRPIALVSGIVVIFFLAYLTHLGAEAPEGLGAGETIEFTNLDATAEEGLQLYMANGCGSCHRLKGTGAPAPGPDLTNVGGRPVEEYVQIVRQGPGIMPAFEGFTDQEYTALGTFLAGLGTEFR